MRAQETRPSPRCESFSRTTSGDRAFPAATGPLVAERLVPPRDSPRKTLPQAPGRFDLGRPQKHNPARPTGPHTLPNTIKTILVGKARDPMDPRVFHSVTLAAFLAWVGLGADGLSSSAYGPEEAFKALGSHAYLSVFLALMIAAHGPDHLGLLQQGHRALPRRRRRLPRRDQAARPALRRGVRLRADLRLRPDDLDLGRLRRRPDLQHPARGLEPQPLLLQVRRPRRADPAEPARGQGERADPGADLPRLRRDALPDDRRRASATHFTQLPGRLHRRRPRGRRDGGRDRVHPDALHHPARLLARRRRVHRASRPSPTASRSCASPRSPTPSGRCSTWPSRSPSRPRASSSATS